MMNTITNEKSNVNEMNGGFSANSDKLAKHMSSGEISEMEELFQKTLFDSLVSNLADAERRLKSSTEKEYKKNYSVYESLMSKCSSFVLKDKQSKIEQDNLLGTLDIQLRDDLDKLLLATIDLLEALQKDVNAENFKNFRAISHRLDDDIVGLKSLFQNAYDKTWDSVKYQLKKYFISQNLLEE